MSSLKGESSANIPTQIHSSLTQDFLQVLDMIGDSTKCKASKANTTPVCAMQLDTVQQSRGPMRSTVSTRGASTIVDISNAVPVAVAAAEELCSFGRSFTLCLLEAVAQGTRALIWHSPITVLVVVGHQVCTLQKAYNQR